MKHRETSIQYALTWWLSQTHPDVLFTTSLVGLNLNMIEALRVKRLGYRSGTPDLLIFEPRKGYYGLFLELKAPQGRVYPAQKKFIQQLIERGYRAEVCFGLEEAQKVVEEYLSRGGDSRGDKEES